MRLVRASLYVTVLVGLLGLAACGSGDDATAPSTTPASTTGAGSGTDASSPASSPASTAAVATLERVTWTLTADSQLGVDLGTVDVTAQFVDGRVAGTSGCNRYTGSYTTRDQSLTIGANLASTMMACPAPQMAVEQAFLQVLPTVATHEVDGSSLRLLDASGKAVLVFTKVDGDQALAGNWTVTAVRTPAAVTGPVAGSDLTLAFDAGQASGYAGCNQFSGTYEVAGEQLTFGPLASTRRACIDPAVTQQETDYLAALQATASFSATSQMLTLLAADGTITVTMTHAAESAGSVPST